MKLVVFCGTFYFLSLLLCYVMLLCLPSVISISMKTALIAEWKIKFY